MSLTRSRAADEFRIGLAHELHQHRHEAPHQRLGGAEQLGVAHGAAHDAAQHVATALVRGIDAVRHQEGRGAQVVGDDAVARRLRPVRVDAGEVGHGLDDGAHQVRVVVRRHALQDGRDALEAHAGVDRGARQRHAVAGAELVVLHEDEVPELQEPVPVLVGTAGRPAPHLVALVVEDLRTGAAGAGVAGGPEIVRGGDADDAAVRQAGDLLPQVEGLVVVVVDGDEQPFPVQPEAARDELPGVLDGGRLEVVAEREVAQHLEERVVARRVADVVEVVVLAAGAQALLCRGGARIRPLLDAGEEVLELHHAGAGEHQRGVVSRNERARGDDLVAGLAEEVEENRAGLVDACHGTGTRGVWLGRLSPSGVRDAAREKKGAGLL